MGSCGDKDSMRRLDAIATIVNEHPQDAQDSLKKIDRSALKGEALYYYDFLTVKADDKAYVVHKSDSVIQNVLDYYSAHPKNKLYPEVLYYCGRVCSDIGDHSTAIAYYQQAIEAQKHFPEDLNLKARIYAQKSDLLTINGMYEEAYKDMLETIRLDSIAGDTLGVIDGYQCCGVILKNLKKYKEAEHCVIKSLSYTKHLNPGLKCEVLRDLAMIKAGEGDVDSCIKLLKSALPLTDSISYNQVAGLCAWYYLISEHKDSAYLYAKKVIANPRMNGKIDAYHILLSSELRDYSSIDTLELYLDNLIALLKRRYNQNQSESVMIQNSKYNYIKHLEAREQAEKSVVSLKIILLLMAIIILVIILIFLLFRLHTKTKIVNLQSKLKSLEKIRENLQKNNLLSNEKETKSLELKDDTQLTPQQLRDSLRVRVQSMCSEKGKSSCLSETILNSSVYRELRNIIDAKTFLSESNTLWKELESLVLSESPDFFNNLRVLVGSELKAYEKQTCILIWLGVTPTEMSVLLNKAKGTISSRRETLSKKLFGIKLGNREVDNVIRSL